MHVQLPVLQNYMCKNAFRREGELVHVRQFDSSVICAGRLTGVIDTCQGDSGGPLMLPVHEEGGKFPFYQIGIVSYGIGCGTRGIPGVYANVRKYIDWIEEKLKI